MTTIPCPSSALVRPVSPRLLLFLTNGVINSAATWVLYNCLWFAGIGVGAAYSIAFLAGIVLSAVLNVQSVFRAPFTVMNFILYASVYVVVWLVGLYAVLLLVGRGTPPPIAPLIAMVLTVPLSYALSRAILRRAE